MTIMSVVPNGAIAEDKVYYNYEWRSCRAIWLPLLSSMRERHYIVIDNS